MNKELNSEIIFNKPYCQIVLNRAEKYIKFTNKISPSMDEIIEITNSLAKIISDNEICRLLIYIPHNINLSDEVSNYVIKDSFPFYHHCGIRHIAYLIPKNIIYTPLSLKNLDNNFSVEIFSEESKAITCLLSHALVDKSYK